MARSAGRARLRLVLALRELALCDPECQGRSDRPACLTILLSLPDLPDLVVLDEPELGLHPYAIVQLADMLRVASTTSQILIATQSVTLIKQFEVDDLIVVERDKGASVFRRLASKGFSDRLEEYSLGELWEKNLLDGRPQAESR